MRDCFHDFLFSKGFFIGEGATEHAPETLAALAKLFNIRITSNPEQASLSMVNVASRNLGVNVPPPFYQGFPQSVLQLSIGELVLDRLLHYTRTYGLGDFSFPGHSLFEEEVVRKCFSEDVAVREMAIIGNKEAVCLLEDTVSALLASSRPLSEAQYKLVRSFVEDFPFEIAVCNCKDTAVRLLLDTRDVSYARLLKLSDIIRLVEQLQFESYEGKSAKQLNLRNRDRVFLTRVLDQVFQEGICDMRTCYEKRKLWKGLLHHLHYQPVNDLADLFLANIRNNTARSVYADFELEIGMDRIKEALDVLRTGKGTGAVLRNLDYLLSRCETDDQVDYVIDSIDADNKILLVQLLLHYAQTNPSARRVFAFQKFGLTRVHEETVKEAETRGTAIDERVVSRVNAHLWSTLEGACAGTLGKVYVDEGMKRIALPLQEGASMSGVGTLTRGSRLPIPDGKKMRAFTYWERVDDIDLSAFALAENGRQIEFSWRNLITEDEAMNEEPLVFSGDETSGFRGGSEYFDINFELFAEAYPDMRYLILCDNVYSGSPFSACLCKAGYMMRDEEDSGAVFEPATVESSFAITCPSTFAYLFGVDLKTREVVWLNTARDGRARIAGETSMAFMLDYLNIVNVINLFDFARMCATEVVDDPSLADVVFSDKLEPVREGAEVIRSRDFERVIQLLA